MQQKIIRNHNGQAYTVQEASDIFKELNDRTESSDLGYNSIKNLGDKVKDLENNQVTGVKSYTNYSDLPATGEDNVSYKVTNDSDPTKNGFYNWSTNQYNKDADLVVGDIQKENTSEGVSGKAVFDFAIPQEGLVFRKNIANPEDLIKGSYYSPSGNNIAASSAYQCIKVKVIPLITYTVSGIQTGLNTIGGFPDDGIITGGVTITTTPVTNGINFTVPSGVFYVYINVTNGGSGITLYDNTIMVEVGGVVSQFVPHSEFKLDNSTLKDLPVTESKLLEIRPKKNLLNPVKINYTNRYSTGGLNFTVDNLGIASVICKVQAGEFYCLSGDGVYNPPAGMQGGYLVNEDDNTALSNITFADPVSGDGKIFQVPTGQNINYVVISLRKLNDDNNETQLHGNAQLELGEISSSYEAFSEIEVIKKEFLEDQLSNQPSTNFNEEQWYKFTEGEDRSNLLNEKAPTFAKHWRLKDKDLVVVNSGTSLTARSIEHCTEHPNANERPPLMHSRNIASILWDKMSRGWNQYYRRYDYDSFFTETGTFNTDSNLSEWDDGPYRNGLTRYSDIANSGVSFQIPINAWQFNFIYRSDSLSSDNVQVNIVEGNGVLEVYDGANWVEANGYSFSMRETTPVTRTVSVPKASDNLFYNRVIASKGNTTYQKRLKFRCKSGSIDSRASIKNISITSTDTGRFNYWGVEWSQREHMITYINAARGSHNTQADSTVGLPKYQDNEVWGFKPDLILFELPIHNDGAGNSDVYQDKIWERLTNNFIFRNDYELSLKSRAAHFTLNPEMITHTVGFGVTANAVDLTKGELIASEQTNGRFMTALDKQNEAYNWVLENHPEVGFVNSVQRWVDAAIAIHGDLASGLASSGNNGQTLTKDGIHPNNTGSKIIAKTLTGLFENI